MIMANDGNSNNSSIIRYPSPKGSIEYVRLNEIDDDEKGRQLIFGSVIVTDCRGNYIAYHRASVRPESLAPGEYLSLSGPFRGIIANSWFSISVNLWVKLSDHHDKQIAQGEVNWNPFTIDRQSMGKHLEVHVGSVTVGFSIIAKAFNATINSLVMMNELPAQIYGTIKAFRCLASGDSTQTTRTLFDKSANECVQVNPGQSIPLTRPFFPVPVDNDLTIQLDLKNHANDQIALGQKKFTPKYGTHEITIAGQVQVSITCIDK